MIERSADRIAGWIAAACALSVLGLFGWLIADLVGRGVTHLSWDLLTSEPMDAGRAGGIAPILGSTGLILAIALVSAAPLGLATALFLAEIGRRHGRARRWVGGSLDLLAAVPSIAFGLFGNALFCRWLGMGFSILSGGLTLGCMILPWITRTVEQHLRSVPESYRLGGAALALSQSTILWRLIVPSARRGLVVGVVLGLARAAAETAALIFTSGSVMRWPSSLFDSGRSVSVHIYEVALNVPGGGGAAYASALVLLVSLIVIQSLASVLTEHWLGRGESA
ncbi:MAG: phosphate ABC transporter permease PstA [Planctomycetota bacterium]